MVGNLDREVAAESRAVSLFVLLLSVVLLSGVFSLYVVDTGASEEPKATLTSTWDGHGLTVNVVIDGNVDRLTVTGFDNSSAVRAGSWTPRGPGGLVLAGDDVSPGASFRVEPGEAVEFGGNLVVEGHMGDESKVLAVYQVSD